jgi:predicted nuclease with TOPRIM domain
MTGTQPYNSKIPAYDHNMETTKYFIEKMCYGILRDSHGIIVNKDYVLNDTESKNLNNYNSQYISESYVHLVSKQEIAENIFEYKIKSQKGLQFAMILPGVSSLGRHFSLASTELNRTRYYSISMCLNEDMKKRHLELIENIKRLENKLENVNDSNLCNLELEENQMYGDLFYMYIKKYNFKNALSSYITKFDSDTQTDMIIRGPFVKKKNFKIFF